ncbi:MAG TPA: DUF2934 domain-containing protein [Alphaproteobacteria bacterium]|nr:DUF2934 domain-containing protein [Alphaproteobacteria bacterium]
MKRTKKKQLRECLSAYLAQPLRLLPLLEQIRQRANQIYLARGRAAGRELDDWLQAEREIKAGRDASINV